jgi:hypothetical protein
MELLKVDFEPQKEQKDLKNESLDGDADGTVIPCYLLLKLFSINLRFNLTVTCIYP